MTSKMITKAEILTTLKQLVDSLKSEPFFPSSEKYKARARAQEILDKTRHTGIGGDIPK